MDSHKVTLPDNIKEVIIKKECCRVERTFER